VVYVCAIPALADFRPGTSNKCIHLTRLRVSASGPKGSEKFWSQGTVLCVACKSRYLQRLVYTVYEWHGCVHTLAERGFVPIVGKCLSQNDIFALMCLGCREGAMFNILAGFAASGKLGDASESSNVGDFNGLCYRWDVLS